MNQILLAVFLIMLKEVNGNLSPLKNILNLLSAFGNIEGGNYVTSHQVERAIIAPIRLLQHFAEGARVEIIRLQDWDNMFLGLFVFHAILNVIAIVVIILMIRNVGRGQGGREATALVRMRSLRRTLVGTQPPTSQES